MIVGITGGTGCGKTTLLTLIRECGGLTLDCDAIYHQLLTSDRGLLEAISSCFPGTVEDGKLNRKRLGGIVFSDPQALDRLNAITHSAVADEVRRRLEPEPPLAAIDAIALFESGLAKLCHVTVAVTAPEEARIARLMARDGISREYARSRIRAQHDDEWFRARCDFYLRNHGTPDQFRKECLAFLVKINIIETDNFSCESELFKGDQNHDQ